MNIGDRYIEAGKVRIVHAVGEMTLDNGLAVRTAYTRAAEKDEVTEEDREAIEAGRRVTRAMREALR